MNIRQMLRAASRTFALSIERLPGTLGEAIAVSYLLLRVSDFLEDGEALTPERKVALLNLWDRVLAGEERVEALTAQIADQDSREPDGYVAQHADEVLAKLRRLPAEVQAHIVTNVRGTTQGMARWVARGPDVRVEDDLDDYMHQVAGRVGYLVTDLFGWYSRSIRLEKDRLMPLAREFGLALQTVNVLRGLRKDYERGWIYVPESFCAAANITREDLFRSEHQGAAMQVVEMIAAKAERHLRAGLDYIKALPPWQHYLRLACMWPLLFAVRTLAVIRGNVEALRGEAKITRREVERIVRETTLWGWSNAWLERYYRKLSAVDWPGGRASRGFGLLLAGATRKRE